MFRFGIVLASGQVSVSHRQAVVPMIVQYLGRLLDPPIAGVVVCDTTAQRAVRASAASAASCASSFSRVHPSRGASQGDCTMKIRKDQKYLTSAEWDNFICAYKDITQGLLKGVDKPSLDDFADEHAHAFKEKNHDWYVHSHADERGHWGLHFFAWHRVFLNAFENRLRREVPGVTIPYWNAFKDPFPEALKKITDNEGETVDMTTAYLPNFSEDDFEVFQHDFEMGYHNLVHNTLGGTFGGRHSPRDATFWLHHAFVDRQWGHWLEKHYGDTPPSLDAQIKGEEIVTGKRVKDVLYTPQCGYVYSNGIYNTIEQHGSSTCAATLEKGMILCAKTADDVYAKLHVYSLTSHGALLIVRQYPHSLPGAKALNLVNETLYYDIGDNNMKATKDGGHLQFMKRTSGSGDSYVVSALNGTLLAEYNGISDFTVNGGEGASDFEMLAI
jgi:tyrosinase-like protein